jgi:hypothetical protein
MLPDADSVPPTEADRYRKMAREIRSLISSLKYSEAITDLRLLAACYDNLAERLEAARSHGTDRPGQRSTVELTAAQ